MTNDANCELLIPENMPKSAGYSQVAKIRKGHSVFIAGQVAFDTNGNLVGKDDVRAQLQQTFENLKAAVEAAGGSLHDLIKLNVYFLERAHLPVYREIRDHYINVQNPPTSTAVQVAGLFRPDLLIEIEAVAVVP